MNNINIIVAADQNNGIGLNNKLPWHNSEDLKWFSKITKGNKKNAILMGKNTWNGLPKKPLPDRENLILSTKEEFNGENYKSFIGECGLWDYCLEKEIEDVWIIGGGKVYEYFINKPYITNVYISRINGQYNCDTFFPTIPKKLKLLKIEKINNLEIEVYSSS
jgi:dihydrofolate reductase